MAQTGYTPILIYSSTTASQAPSAGNLTNSTLGSELAINITDGKLFYKDNGGSVQVIAWKVTPTTAGGTGLTSYTAGDTLYYATGTTLSKLAIGTADYVMTSSGTAPQWSQFVKAISGGTGQTSYTTGDLLYASSSTALSKLADVATGNALISGGVGVAPSWGKIGLTTHVSGTLGTSNGGTGLTSFTANGIVYASSTSALATGSALTYDGTTFNAPKSIATSTSAGALVDTLTLVNASNTTNTEAGIFFSPTTASGNIRGARISAYQVTGNNDIGLKFYSGNGATIAVAQTISPTGDITVNLGNIVQGTAAKGINFTANTGAAGKTSQLLNWYEEGTFTPTFTNLTVVGTPTYTGNYTRIGRMVYVNIRIQSTGSTSSVAGTTYANAGFPFVSANIYTAGRTINTSTSASFTTETIFGLSGGNTIMYTATWTTLADVTITGFYFV